MDKLIDVGRRIAQQRKLRNLTQTQLGEKIGKSQAVISAWEKGQNDPGSNYIILLSQVFDISPLDLLGDYREGKRQITMPDESMMPEIHQGDTLTITETGNFHDGDIVIADTTRETGVIRRLFRFGIQVTLLAFNPAITPINTDRANVKIHGKVTEIHRKL